jgi:hypothetical protein
MSTASPQPARPAGAPSFSHLITVDEIPSLPDSAPEQARNLCAELEAGNILILPRSPIHIPEEDRKLLLGQKQASSAYHKNIAYRPAEDRVTGLNASEEAQAQELRRLLRDYSRRSAEFLNRFLLPYANKWTMDFASFRPIEEQGRPARLHARNDLLHFDSFPTRPTNGARILRLFTNINPAQNRVWLTSQTFQSFAPHFARAAGLLAAPRNPFKDALHSMARALRLPVAQRPPYDDFMHRCHNAMKEDAVFQETTRKDRWDFPPNSTWLVFTDGVSHAVLSGQYALEQTFLIPQSALVEPQRSPLAILQRITGKQLAI